MFFDHNALYEKIDLIEKIPIEIESSFIALIPKDFIKIGKDEGKKLEKLMDALDDLDDIQDVYSNYEIEELS